ncbi:hypothetical protein [Rhizobium sp. J15]|uniref:hypothetical protein n=1 Tax=Rhizobium sp. J15 TaxID=2035450 RepID=UPI001FDFFFDC|nr:hypothetical protein [Rhizobium sp. J15]
MPELTSVLDVLIRAVIYFAAIADLAARLITASLCHPLEKMSQELIEVMLRRLEAKDTASIEQRILPFDILTPESIWT